MGCGNSTSRKDGVLSESVPRRDEQEHETRENTSRVEIDEGNGSLKFSVPVPLNLINLLEFLLDPVSQTFD